MSGPPEASPPDGPCRPRPLTQYSRPTRFNGQPSARFPNESGAAGEGRVVAGDPDGPRRTSIPGRPVVPSRGQYDLTANLLRGFY